MDDRIDEYLFLALRHEYDVLNILLELLHIITVLNIITAKH